MRSMEELRALADQHGVEWDVTYGSRELMDALREALGVADPSLNLDPMKAGDLKNEIAWGSDRPFQGLSRYFTDRWVVEKKMDGARARVVFGTTANSVPTGRRSDVTFGFIDRGANFPQVSTLVVPELAGTVIDCEVMLPEGASVNVAPAGKPENWTKGPLNSIMAVLNINPAMGVARQAKHGWAEFHAFDVVAVAGESVTHLPLSERRAILVKVLGILEAAWGGTGNDRGFGPDGAMPFHLVEQEPVSEESLQGLLDAGFEGGMIKSLDGTYQPGKRSSDWMKVKRMSTGDFFIVGSVPGKGRNEGKVGSLMLAYFDPEADGWATRPAKGSTFRECPGTVYVADCRGFDDATCDMLTDPETGGVRAEHMGRVVEIMGQGRTKNDRIRHPHFVRWRDDKVAADCDRSQLELFTEV